MSQTFEEAPRKYHSFCFLYNVFLRVQVELIDLCCKYDEDDQFRSVYDIFDNPWPIKEPRRYESHLVRTPSEIVEPTQIVLHDWYYNQQIGNEVGNEPYKCKRNKNIYKRISANSLLSLHPSLLKLGVDQFPLVSRVDFLFSFICFSFLSCQAFRRIPI
jgi:hypothetical protein